MADSPPNSNGGQPAEAAAAAPGAAPLFRTQNRALGRPAPRSPSNRLVAAAQPVPAQGARRPRPRSRRRSPTQIISSSSEARAAPECPLLDLSPSLDGSVEGWRVGGANGRRGGWGGWWGGRINGHTADQGGLGRPTGPTIDHRLWGGAGGSGRLTDADCSPRLLPSQAVRRGVGRTTCARCSRSTARSRRSASCLPNASPTPTPTPTLSPTPTPAPPVPLP